MNSSNTGQQLRYLEEVCISLHRAGFETKPPEDCHLPILWNDAPLCRITGKGSVYYRREDTDTPQAEDALFRIEDIAAKTLEYMTAMETAPRLKATDLTGDYRILADFGDAVLAGHPTERGVQFVTWEWDFDHKGVHHGHYFQDDYDAAKRDFTVRGRLVQKTPFLSRSSLRRSTARWRSSASRMKAFPSDGIRNWRSSWTRSADCCPRMFRGSGMRRNRAA